MQRDAAVREVEQEIVVAEERPWYDSDQTALHQLLLVPITLHVKELMTKQLLI